MSAHTFPWKKKDATNVIYLSRPARERGLNQSACPDRSEASSPKRSTKEFLAFYGAHGLCTVLPAIGVVGIGECRENEVSCKKGGFVRQKGARDS